jgi:hypothetical protein
VRKKTAHRLAATGETVQVGDVVQFGCQQQPGGRVAPGGHGGQGRQPFGWAGHVGHGGHGGQQAGSLNAPGLTVASSSPAASFIEGHCLVPPAFALGQHDLAFCVPHTAPGLAVSPAFLAAVGQLAGEQAVAPWEHAFEPSITPGLTSDCCWVAEQPITSAAAHKTLAAIDFFMDSLPLEKE